jgi:hypothetical protein
MKQEYLEKVIVALMNEVKRSAPDNAVSFNLFINHEGYETAYAVRDREALRSAGVSMKNLNGEWIE